MAFHALQMADGSVAIMQTVGDVTPEECLAKWVPQEKAKVVAHKPIDPAAIPASRDFRNAWVLNGSVIEHDMDKARDIQRDRLRDAREPMLAALDIAYVQADEAGDAKAKADIAAQKQVLRDVTKDAAIDAATSVEGLKPLTLAALIAN